MRTQKKSGISLRKRFALPAKDNDKNTRIVVVTIDDKVIGVIVDAVSEGIEASPGHYRTVPTDGFRGRKLNILKESANLRTGF